jgi:hypothetical protein
MLSFLLYQMHIMIFFAITDRAQHRYTYFISYEKVHGGVYPMLISMFIMVCTI